MHGAGTVWYTAQQKSPEWLEQCLKCTSQAQLSAPRRSAMKKGQLCPYAMGVKSCRWNLNKGHDRWSKWVETRFSSEKPWGLGDWSLSDVGIGQGFWASQHGADSSGMYDEASNSGPTNQLCDIQISHSFSLKKNTENEHAMANKFACQVARNLAKGTSVVQFPWPWKTRNRISNKPKKELGLIHRGSISKSAKN